MAKGSGRLNDIHWEALFQKFNILERLREQGYFVITAAQINTERESRLMAKFDQISALPEIFRDNRLSILPISRSQYIIGHFPYPFYPTSNGLCASRQGCTS